MERLQNFLFFTFAVPVMVIWAIVKYLLHLIVNFFVAVLQNAYGKVVAAAGTVFLIYLIYQLSSFFNPL